MRRFLLPALLAAAVLAGVGWLVLGGPEPAPGPSVPVLPKPRTGRQETEKQAERPPLVEVTIPVNPPPDLPVEDPPLPPDVWPGEAPPWWVEADRKFRERVLNLDEDIRSVREIAALLEKVVEFPVQFHPSLGSWADEARLSLVLKEAPARGVVEALTARLNVDAVLEQDALRFYPRGKAPAGALAAISRARWAIEEAAERRAGKRTEDPGGAAVLARRVALRLDRIPLRDAARMLGVAAEIPILMDRALWDANPPVTLDEKERPLSEALEAVGREADSVADATGRRIVLLKK